jgi:hypothetical protein
MFAVKDYEGDVLSINEVDADWRMRHLFALGKVVEAGALPYKGSLVGSSFTGTNREHIEGKPNSNWRCSLVEISDIREEDGSTAETIVLKANATCWCARLIQHPVHMEIGVTELVSRVTTIANEF